MKRILIIDDEERIRKAYRLVLTTEGFDVLDAPNASLGTFKMISTENLGLILLDINMPKVDGIKMLEVIREYDPHFRIIVSSVYPVDEQKRAIPDVDDYFDKAHGVDVLISKVKKVLECTSP